jgi:hypothetical protein
MEHEGGGMTVIASETCLMVSSSGATFMVLLHSYSMFNAITSI